MVKTTSVYARVEPNVKEQAEKVLEQLGIPMSNAIGLFLRQIVLQQGIPFDVKLPARQPISFDDLSPEQFTMEIEKGLADLNNGKIISADRVAEKLQRNYKA